MAKWLSLTFSILLFWVPGVQAQKSVEVRVSPVPLWPLSGDRTGEDAKHFVFVNPETAELIVLVPDAAGSGGLRERRFGLPTEIRATVDYAFAAARNASFIYSYTVNESDTSRLRTGRFKLLLPERDGSLAMSGPAFWSTRFIGTPILDRPSLAENRLMRLAEWTVAPAPDPGRSLSFSVRSEFLPGFTEAFLQGRVKNEITVADVAALPEPAASDARRFLQPEWNSRTTLVVGPLFPPGAPKTFVAENYYYGVSRLIAEGRLRADSVFCKGVLQSLDAYLRESPNPSAIATASAAARTSLERTLQGALTASFHQ